MEKSRVSQGQPADQSTHLIERPNTNNWFFQPKSQQRRKGKLYFSSRVPDLDQKILQMNFSHETANADDKVISVLKKGIADRTDADITYLYLFARGSDFFSNMADDMGVRIVLQCLLHMSLEQQPEEQLVYQQGELGYKFYTILRGKVRVTQTLLKNRQLQHRPVAILTKGQSFGELALLSDGYRLTSAERFFKALLYQFQKKSYFSGNTVYEEDESADYLYVIKSGEFRLLKRLEEDAGKDAASHNFKVQYHHAKQFNEIAVLYEGNYFGGEEILKNMRTYEYTVVCTSGSGECYCINKFDYVSKMVSQYSKQELETVIQSQQLKLEVHQQNLDSQYRTKEGFKQYLAKRTDRPSHRSPLKAPLPKISGQSRRLSISDVPRSQSVQKHSYQPSPRQASDLATVLSNCSRANPSGALVPDQTRDTQYKAKRSETQYLIQAQRAQLPSALGKTEDLVKAYYQPDTRDASHLSPLRVTSPNQSPASGKKNAFCLPNLKLSLVLNNKASIDQAERAPSQQHTAVRATGNPQLAAQSNACTQKYPETQRTHRKMAKDSDAVNTDKFVQNKVQLWQRLNEKMGSNDMNIYQAEDFEIPVHVQQTLNQYLRSGGGRPKQPSANQRNEEGAGSGGQDKGDKILENFIIKYLTKKKNSAIDIIYNTTLYSADQQKFPPKKLAPKFVKKSRVSYRERIKQIRQASKLSQTSQKYEEGSSLNFTPRHGQNSSPATDTQHLLNQQLIQYYGELNKKAPAPAHQPPTIQTKCIQYQNEFY